MNFEAYEVLSIYQSLVVCTDTYEKLFQLG
jgi:hypothetical protein